MTDLAPLPPGGIAAIGELLIDFVALESGVTVGEASGFIKAPGGAPANVAVAAARLGWPASFITQVGDDPFGHHLATVLQDAGVDTRGIRFSSAARTMLAFVSLRANGERSFAFYRHPSADMLLRPEDIALDVVDACAILHYGSITLIDDPARSATLHAVTRARQTGKIISYDPNLRLSLWSSASAAREGMFAGMGYAHILKVSEEELVFLTDGDSVQPLWDRFPSLQLIVVTRGAAGAAIHLRDQSAEIAGFSVLAVDTTGAGDGFAAGLLVKVLEYGGIAQCAGHLNEIGRFANAVGALACTQKGAIPALPTRQQVEAFLADND